MTTYYKWEECWTIEEARALSKKDIRELAETIPARLKAMKTKKEPEYV